MTGKNHIGAISEAKACVWLLSQGFYVFNNIMAHGPADLIAWDSSDNTIILIDVKTIRFNIKKDGTKVYPNPYNKYNIQHPNVKCLAYSPDEDLFMWYVDGIFQS